MRTAARKRNLVQKTTEADVAGWLRRAGVERWLERLTGVVLIGFGARLAAEAR